MAAADRGRCGVGVAVVGVTVVGMQVVGVAGVEMLDSVRRSNGHDRHVHC
jgi:hypothetical protein